MNKFILIGATVLATAFANPASAQDMVDEKLPFTGVYVGGSFGYDIQPNDAFEGVEFDRNLDGVYRDTVLTGTGANAFSPGFCNGAARAATPGQGCRNDKDDIAYYGRVGADYQRGNIVVGIMGEFGKTDVNDSVTAFSVTPANYVLTRDIDWEASIRGRLGYAANTTLFYATGGVGYARINNSFRSSQSTNTFTGNGSNNEFGITAGGGLEQKIGKNFSIGLEYIFHRYEDRDFNVRVAGPAATPFTNAANGGTTAGTDLRRSFDYFRWHSIRATAAFRF